MVHPLISMSTEHCCLTVSDITSPVISICTQVTELDVFPSQWYDLNYLNHVCTLMGSDPIQSHEYRGLQMEGSSTHKFPLFAHGGMQQWGVNYWEIYLLVVNWMSFGVILTLGILREIHTKSLDFVMVDYFADIKSEIFIVLYLGFKWVIRPDKNLHGLKDAGMSWIEKLREGLVDRGFV